MFDQVHGFELWYDVDEASQTVVDARLLTPRLPYMGICDEPQRRVREMVGVTLDAGWPAVVRARLGGREGCFQLTDLTSDLFRPGAPDLTPRAADESCASRRFWLDGSGTEAAP